MGIKMMKIGSSQASINQHYCFSKGIIILNLILTSDHSKASPLLLVFVFHIYVLPQCLFGSYKGGRTCIVT